MTESAVSEDISNRGLRKWLTLENLIALLLIGVAFGGGYRDLAAADTAAQKDIEATNAKITEMVTEQKQMAADVNTIQSDIRVMKNDQVHIDNHMRNQEATLKEVVKLLRERR